MKKRDPIVTTILSFLVPFYQLYWFYDTGRGLKERGVTDVPPFKMLLLPIAGLLATYLILLISSAADIKPLMAIGGILMVLAYIAAIVLPIMYYFKLGAVIERLTNKVLSGKLLVILFFFIAPAAVYLVQEKLNLMIDEPTAQSFNGPQAPTSTDAPAAPPA